MKKFHKILQKKLLKKEKLINKNKFLKVGLKCSTFFIIKRLNILKSNINSFII